MALNLKKLWPAAAASLVAFTSFLTAADDTQMRNLENRVSALEQRKGSNGMINPPARPMVRDGVDLFVQVSPFIWQAEQSGLDYAMKWNNSTPASNNSGSGRFKHPHFEWDWGFKLGAGFNTCHDGWDVFLQWTRFHPDRSHASTGVTPFFTTTLGTAFPAAVVYPLLLPASTAMGSATGPITSTFGPGSGASMSWKFRLDLLDLELGREFFVSKWLTLRPHAGLRSAWLHQRSTVHYYNLTNGDGDTEPLVQIADMKVGLKNNFWGMGPRAGLDAQWGMGCGWSLYSDFAASLLLGHFSIYESQEPAIAFGGSPVVGSSETFEEKYRAMRAAFDLEIGIRYQQLFCCDQYGLMVQLGWEQHLFVNQNQLTRLATVPTTAPSTANSYSFTPVTNQGDLGTQGVTLTVEFDF